MLFIILFYSAISALSRSKNRVFRVPEVRGFTEKHRDARAVKIGAHAVCHAAAGDRFALLLQAFTQLQNGLRAGNVNVRHAAQGEDHMVVGGHFRHGGG